jgi:hypothetical protein
MSHRLSVFCKVAPPSLDEATVRRLVAEADLPARAEEFGVTDAAAVDAARAALQVEAVADGVVVRYRTSEPQPIRFVVESEAGPVHTASTEARSRLDRHQEAAAQELDMHLTGVVAIVSAELGEGQTEDMGVVFANLVAEHVARTADGVIEDQNGDWSGIDPDGAPRIIMGPAWR